MSIQETISIEEFNQGNKAIDTLDEKGRYADTVLSSFVNPHLKEMDEFVQWYKFGPQFREEKGHAFIGKLRHLDVFGVPQMNENQFVVYEKQNVGLNISPLRAELESRYLLHVNVDLCVWLIKSDSCYTIV